MLFAAGDVIAQQGVERIGIQKHNYARTGRMTLYGGGTSPLASNSSRKLASSPLFLLLETHYSISYLRPCRNDLVSAPFHTRETRLSEQNPCCACDRRPGPLRTHELVCFPEHHGYPREEGSCEENRQYL